MATDRSPYETVLGAEFADLHPRLTRYFAALPEGSVGFGQGAFDVVGTPRRWLWPVLAVLGRAGVIFPVWEHDVPFTVTNRAAGGQDGAPSVAAIRRFSLRAGERVMTDLTTVVNGELVDRIGTPALLEASFHVSVEHGGLHLRSHRVTVRFGRVAVQIPARFSPVVHLSERFDDAANRQVIALTVDAPLLGRLYEYSGTFRYSVPTGGETP